MIFIILLTLIISGNIYLGFQFHKFFPIRSRIFWIVILLSLTIVTQGAMFAFQTTATVGGQILFCVSAIFQGVILYLLLSTLLVNLLSIFKKIEPKIMGYLSLGLTALLICYGILNASIPHVTRATIPIKGLTKEVKIVHLTDIHLGHFRGKNHLRKIVEITNELNPDVVFQTGDLFDAKSRLSEDVLTPFKELKAKHYFVEGNHDKEVGVEQIKRMLKSIKINYLENEIALFGELQIVGLKHMRADKNSFDLHVINGETIQDVLSQLPVDTTKPTIMLHHSPNGEVYANDLKIDLLLAGHTHKGQLFPLTLIAEMFFAYNDGLHKYKDINIYVSEGVGTMFTPMRIGTRSEISFITLVPE